MLITDKTQQIQTVLGAYNELLTEAPTITATAGAAAFKAAMSEYDGSIDPWSVEDFLTRVEELLEELIGQLYPDQ